MVKTFSKKNFKSPLNKNFFLKSYYIYGIHPAIACLQNPARKVKEILCTEQVFESYKSIILAYNYKIIDNKNISLILPDQSVHQGIAVKVDPLNNFTLEDINFDNPQTKIALLDQITDPHNIGAIIRSAAAFGIEAIILTDDNAPTENAIIAKSASGGLEQVKIIRVTNLSSTIKILKKKGFWIVGFDCDTTNHFSSKNVEGKAVIILGSEGKGMRRLTRENCDFLVKLPMTNNIESLNVSNAAAIVFYEAFKNKN